MTDQNELKIPPTQEGIDRLCLLWGKAQYANIETELLILRERAVHQQQMETLLAQLPPPDPLPAPDPPADVAPTPIKASGRARGG